MAQSATARHPPMSMKLLALDSRHQNLRALLTVRSIARRALGVASSQPAASRGIASPSGIAGKLLLCRALQRAIAISTTTRKPRHRSLCHLKRHRPVTLVEGVAERRAEPSGSRRRKAAEITRRILASPSRPRPGNAPSRRGPARLISQAVLKAAPATSREADRSANAGDITARSSRRNHHQRSTAVARNLIGSPVTQRLCAAAGALRHDWPASRPWLAFAERGEGHHGSVKAMVIRAGERIGPSRNALSRRQPPRQPVAAGAHRRSIMRRRERIALSPCAAEAQSKPNEACRHHRGAISIKACRLPHRIIIAGDGTSDEGSSRASASVENPARQCRAYEYRHIGCAH